MEINAIEKDSVAQKIALLLIFSIFIAGSIFVSMNLQPGIAPDEKHHFSFSMYYSKTWSIPEDSAETIVTGWVVRGSPFLYYWLNGRIINIVTVVTPAVSEWHLLVILRLMNVAFATASMAILYLTSKEMIKNHWLRLLPILLLANTLMWVFLAGAVSYDNLANLLSFAAILFFVRALKDAVFHKNAWLWIIMIALGCLVKYTILPLAVLMVLVWAITGQLKKQVVEIRTAWSERRSGLIIAAVLLTIVVVALYGSNVLMFRKVIPACADVLDSATCELDPMLARYRNMALPEKLTIAESIEQGYPNPLEYIFYSWIPNMLYRIYGILAHKSYFPSHIIIIFYLLHAWYCLLGFKYFEESSMLSRGLTFILFFYAGILLVMNYRNELVYGFKQIAMQGRYIFPLIGVAYIMMAKILGVVRSKIIGGITASLTILLFIASGPIKFFLYKNTIFLDWFH